MLTKHGFHPTPEPLVLHEAPHHGRAVVCAVLLPHAPILVPAVGGVRGGAAAASGRAMQQAAAEVLRYRPESLVLISPHSPRRPGAYGIWSDEQLHGSFGDFGAAEAQVTLPNDRQLANVLAAEAQSRNVAIWAIHNQRLDHGALVPLWFLVEAGWSGPTVILSLSYTANGELSRLGEAIAAAADLVHRRIAVVASGDMSHRLTEHAPCGFHPQAHHFDETFIRLLRGGEYRKLPHLSPALREIAAEDAVDSTVIAAAAAGWDTSGHQVLNYEGPFGVGYGVAILFEDDSTLAPKAATPCDGDVLPQLARQSVAAALDGLSETAPAARGEYLAAARGIFVTIRQRDGRLRGCVGTIVPTCENVVAETWRNARLAAFQDARFSPVETDDLADLRFEVSVLHSIEGVASAAELDPERYGVIVATDDGHRGLLLPGIADITTPEQQLQVARLKGGIEPDEPVTLQRFQVDRFEEPDEPKL